MCRIVTPTFPLLPFEDYAALRTRGRPPWAHIANSFKRAAPNLHIRSGKRRRISPAESIRTLLGAAFGMADGTTRIQSTVFGFEHRVKKTGIRGRTSDRKLVEISAYVGRCASRGLRTLAISAHFSPTWVKLCHFATCQCRILRV